jgi:Domain of unknown function (DUF6431)
MAAGEDRRDLVETRQGPSRFPEFGRSSEGARKGCVPMAIVWPTGLDVEGYVAAGREVVAPRPVCPGCRRPMRFWGWYERDVRVSAEVIHRLSVRRARCCERTHALLPGFLTWGRLDAVEVIGSAVETMCGGVGMRRQGRVHELPDDVRESAAAEVKEDWTTYGGILFDTGRTKEAAAAWIVGIQEAIASNRWFLAAYYIKYCLNGQLVKPLFEMALHEDIENDRLWWQLRCYEELGWEDAARELLLGNEKRILASGNLTFHLKLAKAKGDEDAVLSLTKRLQELGPVGFIEVAEVEAESREVRD